jgi:peroxiredoxin
MPDAVELLAAPALITSLWMNSDTDITLASLKGRVVVVGAFQMLYPGCVANLIPQLRKAHALFKSAEVSILGLHTVFEHHAAMEPVSLKAFLHENRISFPVGVDRPNMPQQTIPQTMELYGMQGTPTMLLIDRNGHLRRMTFGHLEDMQMGAEITALLGEKPGASTP